MSWWQIGSIVLLVAAASASATAQRAGEPLRFETLKDAHDRQRAEDYQSRSRDRSLLPGERAAPLGDPRVHTVPPATGYTLQPPGLRNAK